MTPCPRERRCVMALHLVEAWRLHDVARARWLRLEI